MEQSSKELGNSNDAMVEEVKDPPPRHPEADGGGDHGDRHQEDDVVVVDDEDDEHVVNGKGRGGGDNPGGRPQHRQQYRLQHRPHHGKRADVVLGLDFGTTKCMAAVVVQTGDAAKHEVFVVQNEGGVRATPSCVHVAVPARRPSGWQQKQRGRPQRGSDRYSHKRAQEQYHEYALDGPVCVRVGAEALLQCRQDPANTIRGIKGVLGRTFATVRRDESRPLPRCLAISEMPKPDWGCSILVHLKPSDTVVTPEEVTALLFAGLKKSAESALGSFCGVGGVIKKAVVAVPAYFCAAQRQAVKDAAGLAGLDWVELVNDTTAAALAYARDRAPGWRRQALVVDVGGGGGSAALVWTEPDAVSVQAVTGVRLPGGRDFDRRMEEHLLKAIKEQLGKAVSPDDALSLEAVHAAWEEAKLSLSVVAEAALRVRLAGLGADGGDAEFEYVVRRDDFEERCCDLFEEIVAQVKRVLVDAKVPADRVDDVILVGGATRIPLVRSRLRGALGLRPDHAFAEAVGPAAADEAVAVGAALLGGGRTELRRELLTLTTFVTQDEEKAVVMARGQSLPVACSQLLPGKRTLQVEQGINNKVPKDNILLMQYVKKFDCGEVFVDTSGLLKVHDLIRPQGFTYLGCLRYTTLAPLKNNIQRIMQGVATKLGQHDEAKIPLKEKQKLLEEPMKRVLQDDHSEREKKLKGMCDDIIWTIETKLDPSEEDSKCHLVSITERVRELDKAFAQDVRVLDKPQIMTESMPQTGEEENHPMEDIVVQGVSDAEGQQERQHVNGKQVEKTIRKLQAQVERKRLQAQKEQESLLAEIQLKRLLFEKEQERLKANLQQHKSSAEKEGERLRGLIAELEGSKLHAEHELMSLEDRMKQVEQQRLHADKEQKSLQAEMEKKRQLAAEEQSRLEVCLEQKRLRTEKEQKRLYAELESKRLQAEKDEKGVQAKLEWKREQAEMGEMNGVVVEKVESAEEAYRSSLSESEEDLDPEDSTAENGRGGSPTSEASSSPSSPFSSEVVSEAVNLFGERVRLLAGRPWEITLPSKKQQQRQHQPKQQPKQLRQLVSRPALALECMAQAQAVDALRDARLAGCVALCVDAAADGRNELVSLAARFVHPREGKPVERLLAVRERGGDDREAAVAVAKALLERFVELAARAGLALDSGVLLGVSAVGAGRPEGKAFARLLQERCGPACRLEDLGSTATPLDERVALEFHDVDVLNDFAGSSHMPSVHFGVVRALRALFAVGRRWRPVLERLSPRLRGLRRDPMDSFAGAVHFLMQPGHLQAVSEALKTVARRDADAGLEVYSLLTRMATAPFLTWLCVFDDLFDLPIFRDLNLRRGHEDALRTPRWTGRALLNDRARLLKDKALAFLRDSDVAPPTDERKMLDSIGFCLNMTSTVVERCREEQQRLSAVCRAVQTLLYAPKMPYPDQQMQQQARRQQLVWNHGVREPSLEQAFFNELRTFRAARTERKRFSSLAAMAAAVSDEYPALRAAVLRAATAPLLPPSGLHALDQLRAGLRAARDCPWDRVCAAVVLLSPWWGRLHRDHSLLLLQPVLEEATATLHSAWLELGRAGAGVCGPPRDEEEEEEEEVESLVVVGELLSATPPKSPELLAATSLDSPKSSESPDSDFMCPDKLAASRADGAESPSSTAACDDQVVVDPESDHEEDTTPDLESSGLVLQESGSVGDEAATPAPSSSPDTKEGTSAAEESSLEPASSE